MNLGKVTKNKDGFQVVLEKSLNFPVEIVWDAITNPDKLSVWFTDIVMDFAPGGKMVIRFRDEEKTESLGRIIRIEPPTLFEFTWEDELATWEIISTGASSCKLRLNYSKLDEKYAITVPAGWHILLDQLEEALDGQTTFFPFGSGETEKGRHMKAQYAKVIGKQFPELNQSTQSS